MAYITREIVEQTEQKFGIPQERETTFEMPDYEFSMVKASQKHGRKHDVTIFIRKGDKFIFNAKHWYPKGMCRAPSGAAKPGETLEEGALREAYEETGCVIKLDSYILRINCRFTCGDEYIDWISHIFTADFIEGDLQPRDTREIREVFVVEPSQIPQISKVMETVDSGGIHYRAYLTDVVMKLIQ
ncbi:MAG: NUDIX domain-containing protein [candidate division Zixibacteria bacterium]|nr:NUDIX domain-containing protein [candidate division Zixibacteria bacterium]